MGNQTNSEEPVVSIEHETKTSDGKLFCRRCWRVEYHFHSYREQSRRGFAFWRLATLGMLDLIGPYRCRCCGHRRFWGIDFSDAQQARQGGPTWKSRPRKDSLHKPFRKSFSISRLVRKAWRGIKRWIPGRGKRRHRRS